MQAQYPISENDVTLYETDRTRLRFPAMTGAQLRLALNELGDEQMESIVEMLRLCHYGDVGIEIAGHMRADARSSRTRQMMDNFGVVQGVKEHILRTHDGSNDSDPMSIDAAY